MTQLKRALTLYPTTAIVIGSVVGSGIFVVPVSMAAVLGSASEMLLVWVVAGMLTLFGALTQCELVALMPRTGGLYEYFREIYGEGAGFLYGWANFTIAGSGAIAAIAIIFAYYLGEFVTLPPIAAGLAQMPVHLPLLGDIFPFAHFTEKIVAGILVVILTYINVRGVKIGATLQSISTTAKVVALLGIVAIVFIGGAHIGSVSHWSGVTAKGSSLSSWTLLGAIATAITKAFWAYDGWGNTAYIAGEVKEPQKIIPKAIILGTLIFTGLYLLLNLAYLYILPVDVIAAVPNERVASAVVTAILGTGGGAFVAALIMLSTFDTTNSGVLTNARVYYAMAHDKIFAVNAAKVHPRYRTPYVALWLQGGWSLFLLLSGSFDLILDMYIFVNWALYAMMATGVFILRKREPKRERTFRVPGYPFVPAIFVLFASSYVVITLVKDINAYHSGEQPIISSLAGVLLVLAGLPFYYFWKFKQNSITND
ncbi:MAG TPA: amino acid permease [Candidatus Kapabacteria bacterium]|nr:amino acid permease [Candidatus Kapabacteria bacterium]